MTNEPVDDRPPDVKVRDAGMWLDRAAVDPPPGFDPAAMTVDAETWAAAAADDLAADPDAAVHSTIVYRVERSSTPWGHAIRAEVLRGYSVVGQLALRVFDPWNGAIPFAEVDGRLVADVVGVGSPDPAFPWRFGIWVEGIALDDQTLGPDVEAATWLASRLIVDGVPVAGGSVPA